MSMIVFNKKLVTEHNQIKKAWNQLLMQRESFNVNQNNISAQYGGALEVNQAALISKDYWREVDNITTRVFRNDEGNGLLDDLSPASPYVASSSIFPPLVLSDIPYSLHRSTAAPVARMRSQLMNHSPSLFTYVVVCSPVSVITHTRVNVRGSRC
jgi:hypothetical protein